MSESKQEIPLYKDSALKKLLDSLALKLQEILGKYPVDTTSLEDTFSRNFLNTISELLTVITTKCIPLVDEKNIPSNPFSAASAGDKIKDLVTTIYSQIRTKESVVFEEIIKQLPHFIKKARKNPKQKDTSLVEAIYQQIDIIIPKLKDISAAIPGPTLEALLAKFKKAIQEYNFPEDIKKQDFFDLKAQLLFYDGKWHIKEINLFHPMMIEFLIEVRNIISKTPVTIKELAPFLNPNLFKMFAVTRALSLADIKLTDPNTTTDLDENFNISFEQKLPNTPERTSTFLKEYQEHKTKILNIIASLLSSVYRDWLGKTQVPINDIIALFFSKTFKRLADEAQRNTPKNTALESPPQGPALAQCITAYREKEAATKFYMEMLDKLGELEDSFCNNPEKTFIEFFTQEFPGESLDDMLLKPNQQDSKPPAEHKTISNPEPQSKTSILCSKLMLNLRFKQVALKSASTFRTQFDEEQTAHITKIQQAAADAEERFNLEYKQTLEGFKQQLPALEEQKSQPQTMETVAKNTGTLTEIHQLNNRIDSYSKALQALPKGFDITKLLSPLKKMQSWLHKVHDALTKQNQEITRANALAACDTASLEREYEKLEQEIASTKATYEGTIQQLEQEAKAQEDLLSQEQQTLLAEAKNISSQILNTLNPQTPPSSRIIWNINDEIEYIRTQFTTKFGSNLDTLDLIEAETITKIKALIEPATTRKNFPFEGIKEYFGNYEVFLNKISPFCVSKLSDTYHKNPKLRKITDYIGSAIDAEKTAQEEIFKRYKNSMMQGLNAMECFRNLKEGALPRLQELHKQLLSSQEKLESFRQATNTKKESLKAANTQRTETMAKAQECLKLTIAVFKSINALKKEMSQDNQSPCTWTQLQQQHEKLLEDFNTLKRFESNDPRTIADIQSQIDKTTGQWQQALKARFIESLKKDIDLLSKPDAKIRDLYQTLEKIPEAELVSQIPTFVDTIPRIHQEISIPINSIRAALHSVKDCHYLHNLDIQELQVQDRLNDCIRLLFQKRDQLLLGSESEQELKREDASWTTIKQQIEAITFSEVGDEYQANDTKLRKIRSAFDTICKINDLIVLMQNTPDPRNVERVNIQVTLSGKETLNAQIKTRIGERGKQYRSFLGLLTNYKQKKYNRLEDQQLIDLKEHYPASFIVVDLKTLLKNYNESACHEKVIRFIQETLPHCSDIHLSSILNQIAIGLIDFNDERPEYNPLEQPISDPPKSALEQLNTLGQDNNARLMHTLYAQIEKIITFAEALPENQSDEKNELLNLMRAAKKDVDTFISQNRLAQVTDFKPLVERLKFRLHSKDDVMSKHFRQWPRIIFNIITLPFLIVFKLPHSLYSTGKLRFFLAETDKEKQLKTLEDKLDKLLTP